MTHDAPSTSHRPYIKDLLLLFSVPVAVIALVIAFVYMPRLFADPQYDFIYCQGYSCSRNYSVDDSNHITTARLEDNGSFIEPSALYYYDVGADATRRLTVEDAKSYRIDANSKSADGYTVVSRSGSDGFIFGGYTRSWSLRKGLITKPLNFVSDRGDNEFIGWVVEDGK